MVNIDIDKRGNGYKDDIEECINAIYYLFNLKGKPPTVDDYDNYAKIHGLTRRRNLEKKLNKKWSEICIEYLGSSNQREKSKEEIYLELLKIKNMLGRVPKASELKEYNFNFRQCYRAYGMTYNETIQSFGWDINREWISKSNEELITEFIDLYEELGRIPTYIDIDKNDSMANSQTYKRRIGSILDICQVCGIELSDEIVKDYKYGCGLLFVNKNNELCLSQPELIISNFLIDHSISYIKEYKYNNIIPNEDPRRKFDWYLPDYNVFIEYFGMYDLKRLHQNDWGGRYTRKALDKINKCKKHNVSLIALFPEDIIEDLNGFKNKLYKHINHKTVSVETMCS